MSVPDLFVAVEANALGFLVVAVGRRLSDIVEENGEHERESHLIRKEREHEARVHVDVPLGMELRRLLATLEVEDLGDDLLHQSAFGKEVKSPDA